MAATTDPNAVYYSYRGVGTNTVVQKFIDLLDKKGIPHRGSESEPIDGSLTNFEEEIGRANISVIFYSQEYFESEHCMNEYACILKNETKACKEATYYVKCGQYDIDKLVELWGGRKAKLENKQYSLTPIESRSLNNGCYLDKTTTYSVQNLDTYFSDKARYKEDTLQTLVNKIADKRLELSNKNTTSSQSITTSSSPHFTFYIPDGLMSRDTEEETLFNLVSRNRIVNLVGVGGSGKSSLAYLSLKKHEKDFNEIPFVVVNNNVKNDMVDQLNRTLKLEFKEDAYTEVVSYLQENFKSEKDNLLVLDINETADKDKTAEYINEILKNTAYLAGWKILILSRESVDTRNRIKTYNLNDKEDFDFLKKLFLEKAGARYNDFGDFEGLFKVIYYNPLLAEQLGLYLCNYPKTATLDDIKLILGDTLREEEMQGMSAQRHDEKVISFLKKLIIYDKLEANEQILLRHFVLWQSEYIGYDVIADLLEDVFTSEDELTNTLKSLSRRSILATNNEGTLSYKLHGLLKDSLREQIDIENEDYDDYLWNVKRIIKYGYYKFVPFVDCIGNSLCDYDITNNFWTLNNVAVKYYNSWKANYSEKLYNKAIKICLNKLSTDKDNATYQNDLASVYNNLANLQQVHLGDYDSAKTNYEKAIAIQEQLPKDNPEYQNDLARTYMNLANLQDMKIGDYDSAKSNNDKAIAIQEQLPKDNPEYQNDLASSYNNLGILQQNHLGDYDSAKANYEKAIAIGEQLPKDNPEYQNRLARAYYNLAHLQHIHFGDYDSAKANYEKAIAIGKQLPKDNPEYQNDLASAYNNLAVCLREQKNYEAAELNINSAITIRQRLSDLNPNFLVDLLNSKLVLAEMYLSRHQPNTVRQAIAILDEIKPLAEKYLSDNPNNYNAKALNKEINNLSNGFAKLYKKGCIILIIIIVIIIAAIIWICIRS